MLGLVQRRWRAYARGMLGVYQNALLMSAVLFAASLSGCAPKGTSVDAGTRTPIQPGPGTAREAEKLPDWFPRAVNLRVHPATRFVVEERDGLVLEARVELLDQQGEPIKGVGRFVCEFAPVGDGGEVERIGGDPRLFHFELDVLSAEDHAVYWDPIARAYVLPLKIGQRDPDLPGKVVRLWVWFDPAWPGAEQLPTGTAAREPVEVRVDW